MQQRRKLKPRGRPFTRGTSGNPKGNEDVKAAARQYTVEAIHRLAIWLRSDDSRASFAAADQLLDRAWGRPSQDLKLQGDLLLRLADVVREARARALAVDAKAVIEHEPPLAIGHEEAAEDLAFRKEVDQGAGQ